MQKRSLSAVDSGIASVDYLPRSLREPPEFVESNLEALRRLSEPSHLPCKKHGNYKKAFRLEYVVAEVSVYRGALQD